MKINKLTLVTLVAVMIAVLALLPARLSAASTLVVDDDGFASAADCNALTPTYSTISAAVAAASPGDTIKVCAGTYNEQVQIDKTLTLLGAQAGVDARTRPFVAANESIIDNACGPVQIMADKVVLNGFTVQGSTLSDPCYLAGIWTNPGLSGTQGGHQILNNLVQNNISGIELDSTCVYPTLVQHNLIQNNNNPGPGSGNAIQTNFGLCNAAIDSNKFSGDTSTSLLVVAPSDSLTVSNNELVGGSPERIFFAGVTNSSVTGNKSIGSTSSGTIRLYSGNSNISINNNVLRSGQRGIRIDDLDTGTPGGNSNVSAHNNCIAGNALAGLEVATGDYSGGAGSLNAENNWWGSASGPMNANNPGGTGDKVVDPDGVVDFTPWLTTAPGSNCPLPVPTNKDQCKNGGWASLARADGTKFKNQGDCIQYVNTGK